MKINGEKFESLIVLSKLSFQHQNLLPQFVSTKSDLFYFHCGGGGVRRGVRGEGCEGKGARGGGVIMKSRSFLMIFSSCHTVRINKNKRQCFKAYRVTSFF